MNAKTFFLICLCVVINPEYVNATDPPDSLEVIILNGTLDLNPGPNDVEAYKGLTSVSVCFNKNFGNVSISIYNASGFLVYSDVVNTAVQQTANILFLSSIDGYYRLVLESATGYAEGEFYWSHES